jgi:hypothetical protein
VKAYENANYKNIGGNTVKIQFSDPNRRKDVLNDEEGYELSEKNCKILHITFNDGCQLEDEHLIRDVLKKYGKIKGLYIDNKHDNNISIHVEYYKPEEAYNAMQNLMKIDSDKKKVLGDSQCDVKYYFMKNKIKENQGKDLIGTNTSSSTNTNTSSNNSNISFANNKDIKEKDKVNPLETLLQLQFQSQFQNSNNLLENLNLGNKYYLS